MKSLTFKVFLILMVWQQLASAQTKVIYISKAGSDANLGTINAPFATFEKVNLEVKKAMRNGNVKAISVFIRGGIYYLKKPLLFSDEFKWDKDVKVTYSGYKAEKVVISGGTELNNWKNENGIWTHSLDKNLTENGDHYFRQLFTAKYGQEMLPRAALYQNQNNEYFRSKDPLLEYKSKIKKWDFVGINSLKLTDPLAFCGFTYQGNDILPWDDFKQAEVLSHHSWESSWQSIRSIDTLNKQVYFNSPSTWPVGFFGIGGESVRYRIENIRAALDMPGEWMLDKKNHKLLYIPRANDTLRNFNCVGPVLNELMIVKGDQNNLVQNLHFKNITFSHTKYPLGIYVHTVHQRNIQAPFTSLKWDWLKFVKNIYPSWDENSIPGYSEPQAAINAGQAITITNASNLVFDNCTFSEIGNYAIKLDDNTNNISITNNKFFDLGAGALMIGQGIDDVKKAGYPFHLAPNKIKVSNNHIFNSGKIFFGSIGIFVGQAHHIDILNNEIHDMPYSGISMGWTWGDEDNYVSNNHIDNNHVHHVMKVLADGGAIYTLGEMYNSTINNNHIHDVIHSEGSLGGGNGGIFFDHGSSKAEVKNNLIYYISLSPIKFNEHSTNRKDINLKHNYLDVRPFEKGYPKNIELGAGLYPKK